MPLPRLTAIAGRDAGLAFHGKRKARYDCPGEGKRALKRTSPEGENSVRNGSSPQPTKELPLGSTWALPWLPLERWLT